MSVDSCVLGMVASSADVWNWKEARRSTRSTLDVGRWTILIFVSGSMHPVDDADGALGVFLDSVCFE